MADEVQFEEEQSVVQTEGPKPFLIQLVLSTGLVSTDEQARYALLGVALFATVLAFLVPWLMQPSAYIPESQRLPLVAPLTT